MNAQTSLSRRLSLAGNFLTGCFAAGFLIALWDSHPRLILTAAVGISSGMLILGPYTATVLYTLGLRKLFKGHMRWPLCVLMVLSSVYLLDHLLGWKNTQFALAFGSALLGTVLGHDATLAILELKGTPSLNGKMVLLFPITVTLALLAGYSSFGFAAGSYQFAAALLR